MKIKLYGSVLVFLLITSSLCAQQPAKKMPDFRFITYDGVTFSHSDLDKNKKTLIIFFDATCGHCQKAGIFFNTRLKELKPHNILFVTMDEIKGIDYYMNNFAPAVPTDTRIKILRDTTHYFVSNFLPKKYPAMYVYNTKNELMFYTDGDKQLDQVMATLKAD